MNYNNEKLNIKIIDNVFEIKEYKNYKGGIIWGCI